MAGVFAGAKDRAALDDLWWAESAGERKTLRDTARHLDSKDAGHAVDFTTQTLFKSVDVFFNMFQILNKVHSVGTNQMERGQGMRFLSDLIRRHGKPNMQTSSGTTVDKEEERLTKWEAENLAGLVMTLDWPRDVVRNCRQPGAQIKFLVWSSKLRASQFEIIFTPYEVNGQLCWVKYFNELVDHDARYGESLYAPPALADQLRADLLARQRN